MNLGIKSGPDNWRDKLQNDLQIRYTEVFFDLAQLDAYGPLFAWLRADGVAASLHASTVLDGGLQPNLATDDEDVRRASVTLLQRTIDVAAEWGMRYVVVHPGSYRNWGVRDGRTYRYAHATPPERGEQLLREELLRLSAYGRARGVVPLAETMPAYDYLSYEPVNRAQTVDVGFPSYTVLRSLAESGVELCVDLAHLHAEVLVRAPRDDGDELLIDAATALAPYTRTVHISTTVPPLNGTDSHTGFLAQDYARGAVPTREQLLTWLRLFPDPELWVIPEPWGGAEVHLANHLVLREWLEQVP